MILKQYYLGCLAHASYLLGDEESATAIIVDPQRDIQQYLADADKLGLKIRHVFLSHFHADFVAGHLELRDRCGATIHLGSKAKAEYAFVPMKDGDTLEFPGMSLQVLETPGHTIESISILVFDLKKDTEKPYAVLTGDTLFIGDGGLRLAGLPTTWARISTTRFTINFCLFPMRRWSIQPTAQARCAESSFLPIPCHRSAISGVSITPCSR